MNKILRVHFVCLLTGVLCSSAGWATSSNANSHGNAKAASGGAHVTSSDAAFEQLVDDFVFGTLALSPTTATGYGYHLHNDTSLDDMLDDFSPAGIAASQSFLHDMQARIATLGSPSLDAAQKADIDI